MGENGQEQEKGEDSFYFEMFFFFFNYRLKKQLKAFICYAVTYTNKH